MCRLWRLCRHAPIFFENCSPCVHHAFKPRDWIQIEECLCVTPHPKPSKSNCQFHFVLQNGAKDFYASHSFFKCSQNEVKNAAKLQSKCSQNAVSSLSAYRLKSFQSCFLRPILVIVFALEKSQHFLKSHFSERIPFPQRNKS